MREWGLPIAGAFAAGLGLGCVFFGGLLLTVRRLASARRPALLALASFAVRSGVAVFGLWWVSAGRIERLAACALGFIIARLIAVRIVRPDERRPAPAE